MIGFATSAMTNFQVNARRRPRFEGSDAVRTYRGPICRIHLVVGHHGLAFDSRAWKHTKVRMGVDEEFHVCHFVRDKEAASPRPVTARCFQYRSPSFSD